MFFHLVILIIYRLLTFLFLWARHSIFLFHWTQFSCIHKSTVKSCSDTTHLTSKKTFKLLHVLHYDILILVLSIHIHLDSEVCVLRSFFIGYYFLSYTISALLIFLFAITFDFLIHKVWDILIFFNVKYPTNLPFIISFYLLGCYYNRLYCHLSHWIHFKFPMVTPPDLFLVLSSDRTSFQPNYVSCHINSIFQDSTLYNNKGYYQVHIQGTYIANSCLTIWEKFLCPITQCLTRPMCASDRKI